MAHEPPVPIRMNRKVIGFVRFTSKGWDAYYGPQMKKAEVLAYGLPSKKAATVVIEEAYKARK